MQDKQSLIQRLKNYSLGDLLEAAEIQEALESFIIAEETNFDDAAEISKLLNEFSVIVQEGVSDQVAQKLGNFQSKLKVTSSITEEAPSPSVGEQGKSKDIQIDLEVMLSFLSEAQDHLENIEKEILSLESDFNPKTVNDIFRSMHTIKGVAGFLGLDQIKSLSHELEFILDELRSQKISCSTAIIDVLLEGEDLLSAMLEDLRQLIQSLGGEKGNVTVTIKIYDIKDHIEKLKSMRLVDNKIPEAVLPAMAAETDTNLGSNPELVAKFGQEALETIEKVEQCILTMERTRQTGDYLHESFRSIHTLKGNAGFFGFQHLEQLCMEMESLLDGLRKGLIGVTEESTNTLLGFLDQLRNIVNSPEKGNLPVKRESISTGGANSSSVPQSQPENNKGEQEAFSRYTVKKKDIRVDTEKLDTLFDLIGELITAEAMVIDNPELKNIELLSFPKAAAYLSKITRELQAVTMSIRMIPLEGLFGKMHRLVRDLSHKFGKSIELQISGQETEMDRNIIEEISDPLVHIIRNAVDHGIESTEDRKKTSKPAQGTIKLNAKYEGNEIWITISDDGAGLQTERILSIAKQKGVVSETATLSQQEIWHLIFEPGFSTAKEVSEISGRGVGMDVVKKNIEKLRGQIDIFSEEGKGTDFTLKIPLTLAIIDGVTLRCGTILYSLPIADVAEFQNFSQESLTSTNQKHQVMRLRDEILPVMRLSDYFQMGKQAQSDSGKEVVIILKNQSRKMAVIVDEIVGYKQIVLKALPEYMGNLKSISGCTILGNGEVSLIIDVNSLFKEYLE